MKEINSIKQLHSMVRVDAVASIFSKVPDYKVVLPSKSEDKNNEISGLLNRYKNECGCFTGGLFMGMSVISIIGYFLGSEAAISDLNVYALFGLAGIVFASSIAGKIVGLLWAKAQMIRIVRRVEFSINN